MKKLAKMTPLMKRIALGKTMGFFMGLTPWIFLIYLTDIDTRVILGLLLWMSITGVLIGAMWIMHKHPVLGFKMWWLLRGSLIGAMMFGTVSLLSYDSLSQIVNILSFGYLESAYWIIIDGAILGATIDYFATKYYWQGKKLLK